jgi:hypothetical protein
MPITEDARRIEKVGFKRQERLFQELCRFELWQRSIVQEAASANNYSVGATLCSGGVFLLSCFLFPAGEIQAVGCATHTCQTWQ